MIYYRLLLVLLSPVIIVHILWLAFTNKQNRYFQQRTGYKLPDLPNNCIWFHCASVGEVNTLMPLIRNLHKQDVKLEFIITTNTITGGKVVAQQNIDYLYHCYMPVDWMHSVQKFLMTVKPASIYVMETEIWPNLFTACQRNGVPINIINARLSSRTTSAKSWVKQIYKSCLLKVCAIYARSEKDAESYKLLGAEKDSVTTTGNLKFTAALTNVQTKAEPSIAIDRKYVLVASTHKDEEEQIYNVWKKLKRPELLIIVPRHPERQASIISKLESDHIAIRSKNQKITDQTEVFLLDTVGELTAYFKNAELVIMGGSFVSIGGHNILEPAGYNCAIITGPYMENFTEELALMLSKKAIVQITSKLQVYSRLREEIENILDDDSYREALQRNTTGLTQNVEKILDTYTRIILKNLSSS